MTLQQLTDLYEPLAIETGEQPYTLQHIGRLEQGNRRLALSSARLFAQAMGVDTSEILPSEDGEVPIVGYIGAGAEVFPIDDYPKGQGIGDVPCPRGVDPARTVAAIVRGSSMEPLIPEGWLVFYSRDPEQDVAGVVGKLCVVKVVDGATMLKQVRRGYSPGRFNLVSSNAGILEDQALEWASPVRHMQAPE